jgi:hypothetical protein
LPPIINDLWLGVIKKQTSCPLGREILSRGSTQINQKSGYLVETDNGVIRSPYLTGFQAHARGRFSTFFSGEDFQSVILISWQKDALTLPGQSILIIQQGLKLARAVRKTGIIEQII